jgi:hypothetical protein
MTKYRSYLITIGWRSLPGTNAAAFWAHSKVMKKMNCCEYGPVNPSPVIPKVDLHFSDYRSKLVPFEAPKNIFYI